MVVRVTSNLQNIYMHADKTFHRHLMTGTGKSRNGSRLVILPFILTLK